MEIKMNYPMRSIAYLSEMIHPPISHQASSLQKLHSMAFTDPECQYQNFQMLPTGAQMSNPPGRTRSISCCNFLNDRIQVREEMTGISRGDYEVRLQKIADLSMNHLKIPMFMVQQFVVRSLINPKNFTDSREFMARALLNMESENFHPLERSTDILGLRLALSKGDQKEGIFNLRIESFSQDARSLFLENVGTYHAVVNAQNLQNLTTNFTNTYSYIEDSVIPFLAQFDETP
jgi:hypothetical protein